MSSIASGQVIETFTDGQNGFDAFWDRSNAVGSYDIVLDPLRAGNFVFAGNGTDTAHNTFVRDVQIPSQNFELVFEYLSFDANRGPLAFLGGDEGGAGIRLTNQDRWFVLDSDRRANGPDWQLADPDGVGPWPLPSGVWLEVMLRHDASTGTFQTSISGIDGSVIYERVLDPEVWNDLSFDITTLSFGIEETSTQYIDNIRLRTIPSPGSAILLIAVAGTAARRRRAKAPS